MTENAQRQFAAQIAERLRGAGFQALWAGGCVRDQLLGREPKDYDVATDATPEQIRALFGRARTLAIGAAFGVISVIGPRGLRPIEVTTFRKDAAYSDGRHPDAVTFCDAEQDAQRRDFTINGLFLDPVSGHVLDYVQGIADLEQRVLRAIGDPLARFGEDKLRMLRAVRFAATYELTIDPGTFEAIGVMAPQLNVVSAERIAAELSRMLTHPNRSLAVRLLRETGLLTVALPELDYGDSAAWAAIDAVLAHITNGSFPLSLAAMSQPLLDADANATSAAMRDAQSISERLKLSNHDRERLGWLLANAHALDEAPSLPWSRLQRLLMEPGIAELIDLHEATAAAQGKSLATAEYCRLKLQIPAEELNPPPLATGHSLIAAGFQPGPNFKGLLEVIRDAQLDGEIKTVEEALAFARRKSGQA